MIYFSLLAVLISGGSFFVSKAKIGADTNTTKNYKIFLDGDTVTSIVANEIKSGEVTSYDYESNPNSDIKITGDCVEDSTCYVVENTNDWQDPSISLTDGQYKPAWAFLQEIKAKAQSLGDTTGAKQINSVCTSYVAGAFNKHLLPNIQFTSTSGYIYIPNSELYNAITNAGISTEDPYVTFYTDNGLNYAKVRYLDSYPEAKENSAWLAANQFIVNSVLKPYKDAGLETAQYEAAIAAAKKTYVLNISKEDKSNALTLKYPANLLLSEKNVKSFSYAIDTSKFTKPASGYKTKLYIKPASKKDDNISVQFGPFSEPNYQFSWSEATSSGYVDSSGQKATVSSADYDLTFPQQYIIRAVTYNGDTEKENILATMQTQTEATSSAGTEISAGNSILKITAKPSIVKQGESVTTAIDAINSKDADKQITKVVLYACTGTSTDVSGNESSTCTYKNKDGVAEDAVKASFVLGSNLQFDASGKANLSATWNTSGSAIGNHALMAKAFRDNASDPYVSGSKTVVTIQVTNANVGDIGAGGDSGAFSNLLASQFSKRASDNPKGSKITTIAQLADRIATWVLGFIGVMAFFAIVIGGFQYMGSGGDQSKSSKAKKTILYATLGIVLAGLSFALVKIAISIINSILG